MLRQSLFHTSVYDHDRGEPSYWEATAERPSYPRLESEIDCEVAIIGGGYTGLSAALHLARDHGIEAAVLEAGEIAWGASSRNGGFVCIPSSKLSVAAMVHRYGLVETRRFYAEMIEGTELPKALARDEGFDIRAQGDGNYQVCHHPGRFAGLRAYADQLTRLFGIRTRILTQDEFRAEVHGGTEQFGGMHMQVGHALHPLAYSLGLAAAAARRGARLYAHSRVLRWDRAGAIHRLATATGVVRARRVVVATNGWTPNGLHPELDNRVVPAIAYAIVTRPLTDDELSVEHWHSDSPVLNTRKMLYWYRMLPEHRLLFGARGDLSGDPAARERSLAQLARQVYRLWPGFRHAGIDYAWRGLVCLSRKLAPSVGRLVADGSIYYAFGCHGNGVNFAPLAGQRIARAIGGSASGALDVSAVMAGLPPGFPTSGTRRFALEGAYLWYQASDWLHDRAAGMQLAYGRLRHSQGSHGTQRP